MGVFQIVSAFPVYAIIVIICYYIMDPYQKLPCLPFACPHFGGPQKNHPMSIQTPNHWRIYTRNHSRSGRSLAVGSRSVERSRGVAEVPKGNLRGPGPFGVHGNYMEFPWGD